MKKHAVIFLFLLIAVSVQAQKEAPLYSLCGKSGNCSMSWEDFMKCKKELVPVEKGITIGSFLLTIQKSQGKKDTISIEYPSKGNLFSKSALESIEKLHKDKKMGNKVMIDAVQVLQSGREARRVPGMTIILQ
jgi:hypothetical protein